MTTEPRAPRSHQYAARLEWTGNDGEGTADYRSYQRSWRIHIDGKPELCGSANAAFRGDPHRHDPEDLFLAAIAACHMLSYLALCAQRGVRVLDYEDRASGILAFDADGGRFSDVDLRPVVTIDEGADATLAARLHGTAHETCFIARSCSVPIRCHPTVRTTGTTAEVSP